MIRSVRAEIDGQVVFGAQHAHLVPDVVAPGDGHGPVRGRLDRGTGEGPAVAPDRRRRQVPVKLLLELRGVDLVTRDPAHRTADRLRDRRNRQSIDIRLQHHRAVGVRAIAATAPERTARCLAVALGFDAAGPALRATGSRRFGADARTAGRPVALVRAAGVAARSGREFRAGAVHVTASSGRQQTGVRAAGAAHTLERAAQQVAIVFRGDRAGVAEFAAHSLDQGWSEIDRQFRPQGDAGIGSRIEALGGVRAGALAPDQEPAVVRRRAVEPSLDVACHRRRTPAVETGPAHRSRRTGKQLIVTAGDGPEHGIEEGVDPGRVTERRRISSALLTCRVRRPLAPIGQGAMEGDGVGRCGRPRHVQGQGDAVDRRPRGQGRRHVEGDHRAPPGQAVVQAGEEMVSRAVADLA